MTTSVNTSSSGLISSAGLGSGLDVSTIIKAMVNAESQPLTDLQSTASRMQTKLSALGSVKSYLAAFRDAAALLSQPASWNPTAVNSTNSAAVSASTGSGAAVGSYSVEVSRLAAAQTLASSKVFGAAEAVGAGSLRIEKTAAGGSAAAVDIAVSATDTLASVRDKINHSDSGVTAHIQTDSSGSRLVVQANDSGAANAFRISVTDSDGDAEDADGLSALGYDPAAAGGSPMTRQQAAVDAAARVNGVDVTSASNTLTNVLDGVTLTLGAVTAANTPVSVTVSRDTEAIRTQVTGMVSAYNALQTYLANQTKYDPATKTAATLQGDGTTNTIRSQLRAMMGGSSGGSSTFTRFSDIGFNVQKDGTIVVDKAKLASGLSNSTEMRKLFANSDTTVDGNNGLATQLRKMTDSMLGTDGLLTSRTTGIQSSISSNGKRQADMQTRIDKYEARVRAQYTALDAKMSSLNSLSTYVTQQITQMNKSNN